jgi:hypothetical protein
MRFARFGPFPSTEQEVFRGGVKMRQPILIDRPGVPAPTREAIAPPHRVIFPVYGQDLHFIEPVSFDDLNLRLRRRDYGGLS